METNTNRFCYECRRWQKFIWPQEHEQILGICQFHNIKYVWDMNKACFDFLDGTKRSIWGKINLLGRPATPKHFAAARCIAQPRRFFGALYQGLKAFFMPKAFSGQDLSHEIGRKAAISRDEEIREQEIKNSDLQPPIPDNWSPFTDAEVPCIEMESGIMKQMKYKDIQFSVMVPEDEWLPESRIKEIRAINSLRRIPPKRNSKSPEYRDLDQIKQQAHLQGKQFIILGPSGILEITCHGEVNH